MLYIPDNYDRWLQHDAEQERKLQMLPKCSECDEHIQTDECYEINDELVCPDCLKQNHRKWVEDYCE